MEANKSIEHREVEDTLKSYGREEAQRLLSIILDSTDFSTEQKCSIMLEVSLHVQTALLAEVNRMDKKAYVIRKMYDESIGYSSREA